MSVAIIGAGMAGLACAKALGRAGVAVRLFDKGRGPGGRLSTRRMDTPLGEIRWDHGAQYISASDDAFAAAVEDWVQAGVAAQWRGRIVDITEAYDLTQAPDAKRYVGVPSMNAIVKHLAAGAAIDWGVRIERIAGQAPDHALHFEDGREIGPFEAVVLAVPAEQAPPLLEAASPDLAGLARTAISKPIWAVMAAFGEPVGVDFDGATFQSSPIGWAARNTSKPGRGDAEAWVLQATTDWSIQNLEAAAPDVADRLMADFARRVGAPPPAFAQAHRWRYAIVDTPARGSFRWDANARIGVCGDWLLGGRVEHAWLSGTQLGEKLPLELN